MTAKGKKKIKGLNQKEMLSYSKRCVTFILILAELQICASYVLAFMGHDQIAEALSSQVVITVVGVMIGYFVKALVENLSKHNNFKIGNDRRSPECDGDDVVG